MKIWLTRGGRHGQYEQKQIDDGRIYLMWKEVENDLTGLNEREQFREILREAYPQAPNGRIIQNSGQFHLFCCRMQLGDKVLMPRKGKGLVSVGKIISEYGFDPAGDGGFTSYRSVRWQDEDVPKASFDSELQSKLNAATTFCRINADNVVNRVAAAIQGKPNVKNANHEAGSDSSDDGDSASDSALNLHDQARDQIRQWLQQNYKGHEMERLIAGILEAQGYTVFRSPIGADKGVDLLAGKGGLGFDEPRLCVQVKTETSPIGRQVLDQLIGVMQNTHAHHGLLVSWSGFKKTVEQEEASQFFRVRLWSSDQVVDELLGCYENLSEELQSEIPLQRTWILSDTVYDTSDS